MVFSRFPRPPRLSYLDIAPRWLGVGSLNAFCVMIRSVAGRGGQAVSEIEGVSIVGQAHTRGHLRYPQLKPCGDSRIQMPGSGLGSERSGRGRCSNRVMLTNHPYPQYRRSVSRWIPILLAKRGIFTNCRLFMSLQAVHAPPSKQRRQFGGDLSVHLEQRNSLFVLSGAVTHQRARTRVSSHRGSRPQDRNRTRAVTATEGRPTTVRIVNDVPTRWS